MNDKIQLDDEFKELYPDITIEKIPAEVLVKAENEKMSITAAYALHERKIHLEKLKVDEFNKKNAQKSPGKINHDGTAEGLFTFEQIKRMSSTEVKKHYDQIIQSLKNIYK